jgi:hypothetical protein
MENNEKANLENPLEQYDQPPFSEDKQEVPGTEDQLQLKQSLQVVIQVLDVP